MSCGQAAGSAAPVSPAPASVYAASVSRNAASLSGNAALSFASASGFAAASASSSNSGYVSQLEAALLNANSPLSSNESEEITVNGERGIFLNRQEVAGFRGAVSLDKYPIYQDPCPQIIKKRAQNVDLVQNLSIKYLRPKLQQPGPITIRQEPNRNVEAAPPVIIRQQPKSGCDGGNKVFREAPPCLPKAPGPVNITIPGKLNPPPPRKVIIEKLAGFPAKPGNISVERWVAPEPVKRQVKFIPAPAPACVAKPRNVIIEWEAGNVSVKENLQVLGVSDADPAQYRQQHSDLVSASQLPEFARQAQAPNGLRLAADAQSSFSAYELEGDVQALALVDLEKEGLGEYRAVLQRLGIQSRPADNSEFDSSVQYCPDNCCSNPPPPPPPCQC